MDLFGGKALRNGVAFSGKYYEVRARLNAGGNIDFEETMLRNSPVKRWRKWVGKIPFVRGVYMFIEKSVDGKTTASLNAAALSINIIPFVLPAQRSEESQVWSSIEYLLLPLTAILGIAIISSLMAIVFGPLGKYHAAEHMAANAWERGWKLSLPNVRLQSRVHDGCGTNLAVFVILMLLLLWTARFGPI